MVAPHSLRFLSRHLLLGMLAVAFAFAAIGCGDDDDDDGGEAISGDITVFAASSLTEAFEAIGEAFVAENPDAGVQFNFAASSALATQINEGAPADVFASADQNQMAVVTDAGGVEESSVFATNVPVVAVPTGSDAVSEFADLATPGLRLVLAAEDVPIGRYSREILANASTEEGLGITFSDDVLANLVSEEANVRAALSKVQLDEADAGIVYTTDLGAAEGEVKGIEIPEEYNVIATYPIAALTESGNSDVAAAFVAFVLSDEGQAILAEFGFAPAE